MSGSPGRPSILIYTLDGGMFVSMRIKTSITLASGTVEAIDEIAGQHSNRSRVIEQAAVEYIQRYRCRLREARDLEILNRAAEELNRETEDILVYQGEP